ncbi:uncharacterized protein C8A04DRAFT_30591 [Dichotomopilus funicola]|uniref:Uncharacterized protein n=1 Tax=Dichotomopilus funicola TaxID=1934379 RepID=A0AAN6UZ86_9PEZI|nr:hypothetical protein C8A04DRAFT_30591 [Dichotomopilus funicola]
MISIKTLTAAAVLLVAPALAVENAKREPIYVPVAGINIAPGVLENLLHGAGAGKRGLLDGVVPSNVAGGASGGVLGPVVDLVANKGLPVPGAKRDVGDKAKREPLYVPVAGINIDLDVLKDILGNLGKRGLLDGVLPGGAAGGSNPAGGVVETVTGVVGSVTGGLTKGGLPIPVPGAKAKRFEA